MAATRKYCKEVGYDRKRYWKDPLKERERHLIKKYGVTAADYDRMFSEQSGKCAVCGKTQERSFDVDHCHGSGRVRGLLCTSCNRMIGHAGDNPESLIRAALYLDPQAAAAFIVSFREAMTASGVQVAA